MLVVDTYNVLGVVGVLPPEQAGLDVEGLANMVRASRHGGDHAVLVCDGTPPGRRWHAKEGWGRVRPGQDDDLRIIYAGPGRDADGLIEQMLADSSAARRMTVVSNDRRIQRAARRQRAGVIPSDDFLRELAADADRRRPDPYPSFAKAIPLADDRVRAWLRVFEVGPDLIDEVAGELGFSPAEVRRQVERLREEAGEAGEAEQPPAPASHTPPQLPDKPESDSESSEPSASKADSDPVDPLLVEALEEWRGRLSLDDLDMGRWLGETRDGSDPS
ncbi:MAG: NYN domain-containing protein [Planctomycetota bacterium]